MDSVDNQRHAQSESVSLVKLAKILSVVSASLLAVGNFVFTVLYFDKTANANFFDGVIVPILRVLPPVFWAAVVCVKLSKAHNKTVEKIKVYEGYFVFFVFIGFAVYALAEIISAGIALSDLMEAAELVGKDVLAKPINLCTQRLVAAIIMLCLMAATAFITYSNNKIIKLSNFWSQIFVLCSTVLYMIYNWLYLSFISFENIFIISGTVLFFCSMTMYGFAAGQSVPVCAPEQNAYGTGLKDRAVPKKITDEYDKLSVEDALFLLKTQYELHKIGEYEYKRRKEEILRRM